MKIAIDGQSVDVRDSLCAFRLCCWARPDPGVFELGRGYRMRAGGNRGWLCGTRELRGCPDPLPDPSPERARCCHLPLVRQAKPDRYGRLHRKQRCRTCGTWLTGFALEIARTDPLPGNEKARSRR